jgi:hypothetical protein
MATTEEFMGAPVIGAISTGTPVSTPLTVVKQAVEEIVNIWDEDDDDDVAGKDEKDKEVKIEVVYQEITLNQYDEKSSAANYVPFFAMLILIVLLIVAALYLYKRIIT